MTWYAVYVTATGELVSTGTVLADPLPGHLTALDVGVDRPEGVWNPATLEFEPDTTPNIYPPYEFMKLFTSTERNAIRVGAQTVEAINDFLEMVKLAKRIDLSDSYIVSSVNAAESAGYIAAGRAAEILSG